MLKKKLGVEVIDREWNYLGDYFKIPSTLIIPDGVKRIGSYAFWDCGSLKEVVIPKSVKLIGICAFDGCNNATIILKKRKKNFEFIASDAFRGCKHVKEEVRS